MARTIAEIKAALVAAKAAESTLDDVTSTSKVAEWNLWLDVVAFCTYILEQLFDFFKADVNAIIATQKPHTLQWYVAKAKAFQYGVSLPSDSDVYAVVPPVDESVLIVSRAAAVEVGANNIVRIKVAKGVTGAEEPLDDPTELDPLKAYMHRVKDAGVRLQVTSGAPDDLKTQLYVFYDPLILDADGARLDGTDAAPVKTALNAFLSSLPFNGLFVLNEMIAYLRAVDGVEDIDVLVAEANYGVTAYVPIPVEYTPDAGYMRLNEAYYDTNVGYWPHAPIG